MVTREVFWCGNILRVKDMSGMNVKVVYFGETTINFFPVSISKQNFHLVLNELKRKGVERCMKVLPLDSVD